MIPPRVFCLGLASCVVMLCPLSAAELQPTSPSHLLVYVGTYATTDQDGIHICELDLRSGQLTRLAGMAGIQNPSFLALHPDGKHLYAVSESQRFAGKPSGSVTAFDVTDDGRELSLINEQSSEGTGPCHLAIDRSGKFLVVANYGGGSVTALPIRADGGLAPASDHVQHAGSSVNPRRQQGPHAHCVNFDATGRFLISCDLGLDKILIYQFDAQRGTLQPNAAMAAVTVAPGAGPRHFAFHPSGKYAYAINELNSTVTAFLYDPSTGTLATIESCSTLPADFEGQNSTAEIEISPDGRYLYGSNRGHNSLAIFAIDSSSGKLTYLANQSTLGKTPRNFALTPNGSFLLAANQDSDSVTVFRRDQASGRLTATGHRLGIPQPVCVIYRALGE